MDALPWVLGALLFLVGLWAVSYIVMNRMDTKAHKKISPKEEKDNKFMAEYAEEITPLPVWGKPTPPTDPDLPHSYHKDRLMLMARDPHWLYAYWEITATLQEDFTKNIGEEAWNTSRPMMRLYDITGIYGFDGTNAHYYKDIYLEGGCRDWHIEVGYPDRIFCVDLGRMLPDGRFITLLRSNPARTPRADISDCIDEEWMWIEGLYSATKVNYGLSSPILFDIPVNVSSPEFVRKDGSRKEYPNA